VPKGNLGVVAAAAVGGTAAQLGGGKFANGAITGAFSYATNAGARNLQRSLVDRTITIDGTNEADMAKVREALKLVEATPRGRELLEMQLATGKMLEIKVGDMYVGNSAYAGGPMHINPNYREQILTADGPIWASFERIVGHELGHAVTGVMYEPHNIALNENPIASQFNPPQPERTRPWCGLPCGNKW